MELGIALVIFAVVYLFFMQHLFLGFEKEKETTLNDVLPKTAFSIIVPFRNEAKNLKKLLESVSRQKYPQSLFEIIMVDDFSEDHSQRVFNQWRMENGLIETTLLDNLRLTASPKKDAIARALPIVKHPWIITTDADCILPENWLSIYDQFIQESDAEMIAGPVKLKMKNNWFHQFQFFELLGLQATTIGSFGQGKPFMCNGANFAYTKSFFTELGGFNGMKPTAGGDDVLLLQKAVLQAPDKVAYLKSRDAIVSTKPENDLFALFMQRVRWASKSTGYKNNYAKILALFVLLMNLALLLGFVAALLGWMPWIWLAVGFGIKYVSDWALMLKAGAFLYSRKLVLPLASAVLYPVFAVTVGIYSLFGSFTWKDRKFRK